MTTKSEALRLADALASPLEDANDFADIAAAELRRLHQSETEGWRYAAELEQERKHLTSVLRQVLEVLYPISHNSTDDYRGQADKAITALKSVLQQHVDGTVPQELEAHFRYLDSRTAPEQPEPAATVAMDVSGAHLSWDGQYLGQKPDTKIAMLLKDLPVGTLLYTHPPRIETEQEPVAYWHKPNQEDEEFIHAQAVNGKCLDCVPLYTHPPRRDNFKETKK